MSTSQAIPAPTAPALAPTTNAANFSRPTTANAHANAQDTTIRPAPAATTVPTAPIANPTPAPQTSSPMTREEPQSYNDKLNAADRYWKFKLALATVLIITGLIGIGCFAWIITSLPTNGYSYYGYDSYWSLWPSFITWSVSIVWCMTCIGCFITRKRTVIPGLRVSMDLLLWLGFIITAMFAIFAFMELTSWGYGGLNGYGGNSSSDGDYVLASNNTWVWEQDSSYITIARDCSRTQSSYYYDVPSFKDCAEQDAYVNTLWRQKGHRENVELTGVVCQFFGLVFHFVLFVWACVDTHRYRKTKVSKDAEKLAAEIVQTMIQNGAVIPPPGQAHMRPAMGQGTYYQLPPQQVYTQQQTYPMANMHPAQRGQTQNQPMTPGHFGPEIQGMSIAVAGPSSEKQPRYA